MMRSRISKTTKLFLVGAACMSFCTATASADIVTFWKTNVCPDFGGAKVPIAFEIGVMEAPVGNSAPARPFCGANALCHGGDFNGFACPPQNCDAAAACVAGFCQGGADDGLVCPPSTCPSFPLLTASNGIGGPFCKLDSLPVVTTGAFDKTSAIFNADIVAQRGEAGTAEGEQFRCVVCQYRDKVNVPAISALGMIILMAGLLTAGAYQIGKKQRGEAAA